MRLVPRKLSKSSRVNVCPHSGDLSFASGCVLTAENSLIFGSNAICRYFAYKSSSSSESVSGADYAAAEKWLEWEAVTLAPVERKLASNASCSGSSPPEALAALLHLENRLTGKWLLEGVSQFFDTVGV